MCLERNSETGGHSEGTLSREAPRRGSLGGAGTPSYLLSPQNRVLSFMRAVRAYPRVAGRDIWDCSTLSSNDSTSSSSTFGGKGEGTGSDSGPALPSLTSPSSVYSQCRSHLKWLSFLTAPLQQKVPVFPNAPGCHLHQWLLCRVRNRPVSGSPPHFQTL